MVIWLKFSLISLEHVPALTTQIHCEKKHIPAPSLSSDIQIGCTKYNPGSPTPKNKQE